MSQLDFNFFTYGGTATSTGVIVLKLGPGVLHTINMQSTVAGSVSFYNSTSSSQATLIATVNGNTAKCHIYDLVFNTALSRGETTSSGDITVTFA